jgi:hypothetical protein
MSIIKNIALLISSAKMKVNGIKKYSNNMLNNTAVMNLPLDILGAKNFIAIALIRVKVEK